MFCHPDGGAAPAGTRVGHALGTRRAPRGRLSVLALVSGGEAGKASGGENRRPGTRRDVTVPQTPGMRFLPHCSGKLGAKSGALWKVKLATEKAEERRVLLQFFFKIFLNGVEDAASVAEIAQLGER